jgi:hypothetical protein
MAMRYDSRSCIVTTDWEWVQVSGSGGSKSVSKNGVGVTVYQDWGWDGSWTPISPVRTNDTAYYYSDAEGYSGDIPIVGGSLSGSTPPPLGTGYFGETRTTTGSGTANYSGTVNKTVSYQWGATRTYDNASSSIYYDDGTYAGYLTLDSVSGSSSAPSYSGSYVGQTATTTTSGTAYYSGDVPLKGGGRPANWTWTTLNPTYNTYSDNKLRANLVTAKEWNDFCSRLNEFRIYKKLATVSLTNAVAINDFTSSMYEQARSAIDAMKVSPNPNGFYSKLVALKDTLNSIS